MKRQAFPFETKQSTINAASLQSGRMAHMKFVFKNLHFLHTNVLGLQTVYCLLNFFYQNCQNVLNDHYFKLMDNIIPLLMKGVLPLHVLTLMEGNTYVMHMEGIIPLLKLIIHVITSSVMLMTEES